MDHSPWSRRQAGFLPAVEMTRVGENGIRWRGEIFQDRSIGSTSSDQRTRRASRASLSART
ncbi:MAG: hypothetical protein AAB304_06620, partial [Pseudomonadota bacterium]